ncbi:MAG: hypothetical protein WAQ05_26170, partial [Rubrivivax sp.]
GGGGVGGAGDGGGDGAGGGLGAMRNVRVTARKPDGKVLGTALLQNNLVSLYARTYKDAFVLEFADDGSGNGEYFDEAEKKWLKLNGQSLHILVPKLTHHVSANPLTEAAYQWALYKYGTEAALNAVRMAEANETVRQAFNSRVPPEYRVSDVTNYAVAVSDTTVPGTLPNSHAGRFGTLLAAMPRAARLFLGTIPFPALAFTRQLVKDLRDDNIVNASSDDAEQEAYDGSLSLLLADAIQSARTDYANLAQPGPTEVPNACFNPGLFTLGTKWSLTYTEMPADSSPVTSTLQLEVTSTAATFQTYNPALEVRLSDGTESVFTYFAPDLSAGIRRYGNRIDANFNGTLLSFVNLVSPSSLSRQFLLLPGESETVSETLLSTVYNPDGSVFSPTQTTTSATTTTFIGYETVTVPAGTFKNACKYAITDARQQTTTTWITSSGQGIEVRSVESNGTITELQSGTVNGQAVK